MPMPITACGTASGDSSTASTSAEPKKRWRTSANAAGSASASAATLVASATTRLIQSASRKSELEKSSTYQRRLRPCGGNAIDDPAVSEASSTKAPGKTANTAADM